MSSPDLATDQEIDQEPGQAPEGPDGIAVVGMAGRFPGADGVDAFWENLAAGRETITFFDSAELIAAGVDPALVGDPAYVRARGLIDGPELFDASLFGFNPREAEIMDPQHRLLLECGWQALEHAGYDPRRHAGPIGVYAGAGTHTYLLFNLMSNRQLLGSVGHYQTMLGSDSDFLATRLSYKLDLKGPSLTVQTACSTSLVAVHLAVQALLNGECDLALAGGVRISVPQRAGYLYQAGGILSPDGHCRPFDAAAQGCLDGDGVGMVVLKRLADALADGDHIHAVVRGTAINNDGGGKIGYTAPSVEGQAEVIALAQAVAGVEPETIGYVEAHGTATPLGDPIEVAALKQAFGAGSGPASCGLGSVKSNIGHLDAAAGVAALLKTVMALERGKIPPSLHFERPNPQLDFEGSPFFVVDRLADWPAREGLDAPRRAGVSSFGIGGTNAHAVLEEAPATEEGSPSRPQQLLLLSAATAASLEAATANLVAHLRHRLPADPVDLADIAHTLQVGRRELAHRRMVVAASGEDAAEALASLDPRRVLSRVQEAENRGVAFLFPGQGAQHPRMAAGLYRGEPTFRAEIDRCAEMLLPELGLDLRGLLFAGAANAGAEDVEEIAAAGERLRQTAIAQPALFAVEYSLARLWMEWGVRPEAMLGHSVGEYVAACLAGVFTLEEALRLVAVRGRLMQAMPAGAMLSVPLPEAEVAGMLTPGLAIAAVNTPALVVVAGESVAVAELAARLTARGVESRVLRTSHAFHSAMMDPALPRFAAEVARVELKAPKLPFLSNLSGTWIRPEEATDPDYWVRHLRGTVRFSAGLEVLFAASRTVLLEVGPGASLSALARQHPGRSTGQLVLASLAAATEASAAADGGADTPAVLRALGQLWLAGVEVRWKGFYAHERRRRVVLPTYPFERKRYWVEARPQGGAGVAGEAQAERRNELADWFWAPLWRQTVPPAGLAPAEVEGAWLVFADAAGFGARLVERLEEQVGASRVVAVAPGGGFREVSEGRFEVRPGERAGYGELLERLESSGRIPTRIVHLWSAGQVAGEGEKALGEGAVGAGEGSARAQARGGKRAAGKTALGKGAVKAGEASERVLAWGGGGVVDGTASEAAAEAELGFYSLLALAQVLAGRRPSPAHVVIVTAGAQRVTGGETLRPVRALALGPATTIPQELLHLTCQSVDVDLPAAGGRRERELVDLLLAEIAGGSGEPVVALRGGDRWVRDFGPVRLGAAEGAAGLREGGTYLITGGLGGVGLAIAEHLAEVARARLVLTGRTPLPPRESWPQVAAGGGGESEIVRRLLALEAAGAEVLALAADVADVESMGAALVAARARFGPLHGVVHAAGVAGGGLIELKTRAAAAAVLAPKVAGTLVLEQLLAGEELDFLVLTSSLNALLGGPGQVDYAAANSFLDAFARSRSEGERRVIAIGWDTWRGVGMAGARPGSRGSARAAETTAPFDHPLLTHRVVPEVAGGDGATVSDEVFLSYLRTGESWILDEHRLGGHPIVPGTAYLEMAGAAYRGIAGHGSKGATDPTVSMAAGTGVSAGTEMESSGSLEMRDVLFVAPLRVGDGETREVRTVLSRNGDGFHFKVVSGAGGADAADGGAWQQHVVGSIGGVSSGSPVPARLDLAALMAAGEERVLGEEYREDLRTAGLGARWEGLRKVYVGSEGVLGLLELAPELADDVAQFQLHPALLDVATSFGEVYAPRGEGYYLPLSYKRLRAHGPLPSRFYSYARFRAGAGASHETLAFDVSIVDEEGLERVQVEEFTLKRIDVAGAIRGSSGAAARPSSEARTDLATPVSGARPLAPASAGSGSTESAAPAEELEGMAIAEAVEAFARILAQGGSHGRLAQIAVSTHPLPGVIERARKLTTAALAAGAGTGVQGGHARPDLATAYVAPRTEMEGRLAAIWQEILGISEVGVFDDFFELGGHSLLGTQLVSRVRSDLQAEVALARLFEATTIADFALVVEAELGGGAAAGETGTTATAIVPVPRDGDLPLSSSQERLWFLDRLDPGSPLYNISQAFRLTGALDLPALAAALTGIVARHESLRTAFGSVRGRPRQRVRPPFAPPVPVVDLAGLTEERGQDEAARLASGAGEQSFDLARPPLFAGWLLRLAPERHTFVLTLHHIVSDGWSIALFVAELAALYRAFSAGEPLLRSPLPALPVQYGDFAVWQRERLRSAELEGQLAYWRERLAGAPAALELPLERPRPPVQTYRGGTEVVRLSPELTAALKQLGQREGATLFMTLLAGLAALLYRVTDQPDLVIGSPIAGRVRRETEGLIGSFLNNVALRVDLSDLAGELTMRRLLARVREVTLGAYAHQEVPIERVIEELRPDRDLARTPLYQVVLNWQDFGINREPIALPGLTLEPLPPEELVAKFDLEIYAWAVDRGVFLQLVYNRDLFGPEQMRELGGYLEAVYRATTSDPEVRVSALALAGAAERGRRGVRPSPLPPMPGAEVMPAAALERSLADRFARVAADYPDRVAVRGAGGTATYAELAAAADRVAHALLAGGGEVGRVALLFGPGAPMAAAVLGVLAAGGTYVPLDPSYPRERLRFMLADAEVGTLLIAADLSALAAELTDGSGLEALVAEELPAAPAGWAAPAVAADAVAYLLYTSGSSGRPKGVMQSHRNVLHHVRTYGERLRLGPADRLTMLSSYSFDAGVMDLFGALLHGAALYPWDVRGDGLAGLAGWMAAGGITVYHSTPTVFRYVVQSLKGRHVASTVRLCVLGGEEVVQRDLEIFRQAFPPGCVLVNGLGPTESTLALQRFIALGETEGEAAGIERRTVPVGWPVEETEVILGNSAGAQEAMWGSGEILIRSPYLALGYWRRPELTEAAFLPDPEGSHLRIYRTGDLGRLLPDGAIEFVGRRDLQVKIRGVRVELGEIEAALGGHPGVRECAVVARQDRPGETRLAAYVVPLAGAGDDLSLAPAELRAFLARTLPDAMVPADYVVLPALPLTPTGKVDRRALPAPAPPTLDPERAAIAPRSPVEEVLVAICAELLDLEAIGVDDNFFDLGGHSLLATQAISRIAETFGVDVPLRRLFERPTAAGLAEAVEEALAAGAAGRASAAPPLARRPADAELGLSFAQQRLWFLEQLAPGNPNYNIPADVRLQGALDARALEGALAAVVARHEALRTTFGTEGGRPVQRISPPGGWSLPRVDLQRLPAAVRAEEAERLATAELRRPFDLTTGPLIRGALLRLDAGEHLLLLTIHHIVSDGWSMGVLVREIAALYEAGVGGGAAVLPELPIQYADYALWQRQWLAGPALEDLLAYWRARLAGAPAQLDLPLDRPRPSVRTPRGDHRRLELPAVLTAEVRALGRHSGATTFMTLLAGFYALLHRVTGQSDLPVGSPIANRNRAGIEGLIGFFVNTLVMRTEVGGATGRDLLARVRDTALGAYAHQDLPFERLVEELQPVRDLSVTPLFQTLFDLQNTPMPALELSGLRLESLPVATGAAKFDLSLFLVDRGERLTGSLQFSPDLFDGATAVRLAGQLERLLAGLTADPERPIAALDLLSESERHELAVEWNDPRQVYPEGGFLHELAMARAAEVPERIALVLEDTALSFGELARRAERLARRLRRLGVGPEVVVGVCAERSFELVAGILAVLEAGGVYLPLDPALPAERLRFLLADAAPAAVLAQARLTGSLAPLRDQSDLPVLVLDAAGVGDAEDDDLPASAALLPEHPAYIIYTSGSTGRPKGVVVHHRSAANRLRFHAATDLAGGARLLQKTTISFDVSVLEVFGPLLAGATSVLAKPGGQQDTSYLLGLIAEEGITHATFPPSVLSLLLEQGELARCRSLRIMVSGSEAVPAELPGRFQAQLGADLYNRYGPTEATIAVTAWKCERIDLAGPPSSPARPLPIGRPICKAEIHLLDRELRPVPAGVAGELAIGGVVLARGYLGRPELTAEKFVPDPLGREPGARLYRTGDLARHRWDGAIEFVGRIDRQVKIRGFRVELEEIESVLSGHPEVREAAVVDVGEGDAKRLVAYVVHQGEGAAPAGAELQSYLAAKLPGYMVPALYVPMETLPLSASGKVDRRALPAPEMPPPEDSGEAGPSAAEPLGPIAEILVGLWSELLGRERVGAGDSFFALGGHSLLATRLVSRVQSAFGVKLAVREVFEQPTPAGLARRVEALLGAGETHTAPPVALLPRDGSVLPLSFAQERLWFLDQLAPGSATYNIPAALRLTGPLDPAVLAASLAEIARRHEVLRTTFATVDGRAEPRVAPAGRQALPMVDLACLPGGRGEAEALLLAGEAARRPFDLATGPLARAGLLRLGPAEHVLVVGFHHIVADGWSLGVYVRELAALYTSLAANLAGAPSPLAEPAVQYADWAGWQRQWLSGEVLEAQLAYWRQRLEGAPSLLELPTDRPRPAMQTLRGAQQPVRIGPALLAELNALARRQGATLFMLLLAGFEALLARAADQEDVLVGSPVAGRDRLETESLIGLFVNTIVLRLDLSGPGRRPGFQQLVERGREAVLGAFVHADLPFEKLVDELKIERDLSHSPLFQVMLVMQNAPAVAPALAGVTLEPLPVDTETAKFDLMLVVGESGGSLVGALEHNLDLFDPATVTRYGFHLEALLAAALAEPERPWTELPLLSPGERAQLLTEWNDVSRPFPSEATLHGLFESWAERTPEAPAVELGGRTLSYRDLDAQANRLAHRLLAAGVRPEEPVAIHLERSAEVLVAILGVLKAGGAYIPLDPRYPRERLVAMLEDAGRPVLLTQHGLAETLAGESRQEILIDASKPAGRDAERPALLSSSESLAYVLYTSGSTGRPKGVACSHRGVVNLLADFERRQPLPPGAGSSLWTSLSFDVSVYEIFSALTTGGVVQIVPEEVRADAWAFFRWLEGGATENVYVPPFMVADLVERLERGAADLTSELALRRLLFGVEPIPERQLSRIAELLPGAAVINGYGPTEATVCATLYGVRPGFARPGTTPIGRPVENDGIYLVDRGFEPVPAGVPGELLIGGAGLARGYLGRPEATAERFVPHPWSAAPGERLYRTGDLARRRRDGDVEFLGRADHQIKLRGFRIELGDIESALMAHPSVREAVVLVTPAVGDAAGRDARRLVAFAAVASEGRPEADELRAHLAARLPEYMVPALVVLLDALPQSPNGKVDRKALARLTPSVAEPSEDYEGPRTATEELLVRVWGEVLGVERRGGRVGIHDNFFELGGNSILSIQIVSRTAQAGWRISPRQLFEQQTVARLASVAEAITEGMGTSEQGPVAGPVPLTPIQRWFFAQGFTAPHHFNQAVLLRPERPETVGPRQVEEAIAALLRHHDALRLRFHRGESGEGGELGWQQENLAPEAAGPMPFHQIDLNALPALTRAAAQVQASLDLQNGPLLRAVWFDLGGGEARLLLVIHHLAVDGVTWRVLLEDLETATRQAAAGEAIRLPAKTTSFRRWSEGLTEHARTLPLEPELSRWLEIADRRPVPLAVDRPGGANTVASIRRVSIQLDEEETRALLQEVPSKYGTRIHEALLAALVRTLVGTPANTGGLLVELEGHGREEEAVRGADLSRTAGWFTTLYPVWLDVDDPDGGDPGATLRSVKEGLRSSPQGGIGYGLLRHLRGDEAVTARLAGLPRPAISFNYLGEFDETFQPGALFAPAGEESGPSQAPVERRSHLLAVGGLVAGGRLRVDWSYSENLHLQGTIERLAGAFAAELRSLIEHCRTAERRYTPSDFTKVSLDQEDLDNLLAELEED